MHFPKTALSLTTLLTTTLSHPTTSNHGPSRLTRRADSSPRLVQYIQTFHTPSNQPLSLLPLASTPVTHINLAALHINGPNQITLNDDSPDSSTFTQVWSDVAQLQSHGIKALFMVGGAAQGSYKNLCGGGDSIVEDVYTPFRDVITRHKIDGVDLDIEESVSQACALALLNRLNSDFGPDFLLTMAPVASGLQPGGPNLSGFDYVSLDKAATTSNGKVNGKLVNWYNAQFYNGWGDASSTSGYDGDVSAGGWDPSRVVLGVLDNSGDGGSGYVDVKDLEGVVAALKNEHGNSFGGVAGWEYWDAGEADGISDPSTWDKDIGDAVFSSKVDAKVVQSKSAGGKKAAPEVPWPVEHGELVSEGVNSMEAVKALNVTGGDLAAAKKMFLSTSS